MLSVTQGGYPGVPIQLPGPDVKAQRRIFSNSLEISPEINLVLCNFSMMTQSI